MSTDPSSPVEKKASLFKHRAVRPPSGPLQSDSPVASAVKEDGDNLELFKRSKQFFPKAIEEQEQRLKKTRHEPKKSHDIEKSDIDQLEQKRRKLSTPADEDDVFGNGYKGETERQEQYPRKALLEDDDIYGDLYGVSDQEESRRRALRENRTTKKSLDSASPPPSHSENGFLLSPNSPNGKPPLVDKGKGLASPYNLNGPIQSTPGIPTQKSTQSEIINLSDDEPSRIEQQDAQESKDGAITVLDTDPVITAGDSLTPRAGEEEAEVEEAIDPEFAEYIIRAQARDTADKAVQEAVRATPQFQDSGGAGDAGKASRQLDPDDPIVTILVTTRMPPDVMIPGLLVRVKLSQRMKSVMTGFVEHAKKHGVVLPEEVAKSLVLTWKGSKIYSWSTGKSLRLQPDARGKFRDASGHKLSHEVPGFHSGGLHMEMWTADAFESHQEWEARQAQRTLSGVADAADDGPGAEGEDEDEPDTQGTNPDESIRLVLKSKNLEPVRVMTKPHTTVDTLILAFRRSTGVGNDKELAVYMNGEKLDGHMTVADAELEDMDSVEVHIN